MKKRALTALQHGIPDRVPIYDSLDDSHIMKLANTKQLTVRTKVQCYKGLGFDALPAKTRTYEKQITSDDAKRIKMIDEWNREYVYMEPNVKFYAAGVMTSENANDFEWPDAQTPDRYGEVKEIVRLAGDELAAVGIVGGPFEKSVLGFGFNRFLPMLLKRDRVASDHMRKVKEFWITVGKIEAEIGVDAIMITDDYAFKNGPFFSPRLFEDSILPLLRDEINAFKRLGVPVIHHSDGNISLLLPLLAGTGLDAVQSIEPTAGMDIRRVKREYGDKLAIVGNIDSGSLLSFGSTDEVEETVKNTICEAAPGGSYVLSSSNSLHYGCRLENILTMITSAKKYGLYPNLASRDRKTQPKKSGLIPTQ